MTQCWAVIGQKPEASKAVLKEENGAVKLSILSFPGPPHSALPPQIAMPRQDVRLPQSTAMESDIEKEACARLGSGRRGYWRRIKLKMALGSMQVLHKRCIDYAKYQLN